MNKARTVRRHARRRFRERFGVALDQDLEVQITRAITGKGNHPRVGGATFVERQSQRVTKWLIEITGTPIPIIYDEQRNQLVTALPASAAV